jgi:outer membrane protein OmpA-like peptidoglycan-associated protein
MNIRQASAVALTLAATLALAACSSSPKRNAALEDARQLHQRAQSNPQVLSLAGEEMARADAALAEAERAWNAREPLSTIDHLAYMAGRRVTLAEATASSIASQAIVDGAAAERDRLRLAQRTQEADASRDAADRSRMAANSAQRDAESAQRDASQSQRDAEFAQREAQMALADAEAARREIASLEADLASLNARQTERGLVVTLGDVLFDTGRAQVRPEGNTNLRKIAEVLRDHPGYRAAIEGHTDNVGSASSNYLLSERRAAAVQQSLIDFGAATSQLSTTARGQEYPAASNETASGRQMNRRVEVIFSAIEPVAAQ